MFTSQLCVFDDKTDSKPKRLKKALSMVMLSAYLVYFVKISFCDALTQFKDDAGKVKVSRLDSRN